MKRTIRLTESDLNRLIKESVRRILSENDLTYTQIRNITGIEDDDYLNASVEAEYHEEMESEIWRALTKMAQGEDPRKYNYRFSDICGMLKSNFGLKYTGSNDRNEYHEFKNDRITLELFPDMYYTRQGTMSVRNILVS